MRGRGKSLAECRLTTFGSWKGFDVAKLLSRFLAEDTGATAIEYGLIAGGIALAIVAAVTALSGAVLNDFNLVKDAFP